MAQTASTMSQQLYQTWRDEAFTGAIKDHQRQINRQLLGLQNASATVPLTSALKTAWAGKAVGYQSRSKRTKRTGLSYRQRQARGRAARRTANTRLLQEFIK